MPHVCVCAPLCIAQGVADANTPLFIPVCNSFSMQDAFLPNPACSDFDVYEWVGRLCAASILSDESLVLKLPPLVWKLLGGADVCLGDLKEVDVTAHKVLSDIASMCAKDVGTARDVGLWGLGFVINLSNGDTVELVPHGDDLDLTYHNRAQYVELASQARLRECAQQIEAMRRGLCSIIPAAVVRLWTAKELERRVCGDPVISVSAIKKTARITSECTAAEHLWGALERMDAEDRSLFLRFCTGRARLPVAIKISPAPSSRHHFPSAATCFNHLMLPPYRSVDEAFAKLQYAIHQCGAIDMDGSRRSETFELVDHDPSASTAEPEPQAASVRSSRPKQPCPLLAARHPACP